MKYPIEKRLDIGREVYEQVLTAKEAAIKYNLNIYTIRDYQKLYLTEKVLCSDDQSNKGSKALIIKNTTVNLESLQSMSKEDLINEVIKGKIQIERLKKKLRDTGRWDTSTIREKEYQVVVELSGQFPVSKLCERMNIKRKWFTRSD